MIGLVQKKGLLSKISPQVLCGIGMSDDCLTVVSLRDRKRQKFIKSIESFPLNRLILKNGTVVDKEGLKEILKIIKKRHQINFVNVALPAEQSYFMRIKVPYTEEKRNLEKNILFQLVEFLPITEEDISFSYQPKKAFFEQEYTEFSVQAFSKKVLKKYVDIFKEARLFPTLFENEGESLKRAVASNYSAGAVMIVDYGKTRVVLVLVEGDIIKYLKVFKVSGKSSLSEVVKEALIADGLYSKISKLILTGNASGTKNLTEYLSNYLKIPVENPDIWSKILNHEEIPKINQIDSLSYVTAIGSALASC